MKVSFYDVLKMAMPHPGMSPCRGGAKHRKDYAA
jgi:hypothetical protein